MVSYHCILNLDTVDPHFFLKDIQVAAARAFSILCFTAYKSQPQLMENASFTGDVSEVSSCIIQCWLNASVFVIIR